MFTSCDVLDGEYHLRDTRVFTGEEQALFEWFWFDPPATPLNHFYLGTDSGRQDFLRELYARGDTALFEGVAHVWASLAEPREYRCTMMGAASGAGGTGKLALMNTLTRFISEALAIDNLLPDRADYASLPEWHEAAMASFGADEAALDVLVERYSQLLNGQF